MDARHVSPQELAQRYESARERAASVLGQAQPSPDADRLLRVAQGAATASARVMWLQRAASAWAAPLASAAACRRGCSHCCHIPVLISDVEAKVIGQAVGLKPAAVPGARTADELLNAKAALPGAPREDAPYESPCPFLEDDACRIYAHRPLACRVHINLDATDFLCALRDDGVDVHAPYADATVLKGLYMMAQPAARFADIRAFFQPRGGLRHRAASAP